MEYSRLLKLAQEDTALENDQRLRHVIIYFIQNQAPKAVLERTLLWQFSNQNLAGDDRCVERVIFGSGLLSNPRSFTPLLSSLLLLLSSPPLSSSLFSSPSLLLLLSQM